MDALLTFVILSAVSWVGFMVIVPIAGRIADFSLPQFSELTWKVAVIVLASNGVTELLAPVNGFLSWLAGFVVFWAFMVKWFGVDFFGAVVIVLLTWAVRMFVGFVILASLL